MAFIAQLVEHTAVNRKVHSSNLCESAFFVCTLMCLSYLIIKQLENYEYTRPKALEYWDYTMSHENTIPKHWIHHQETQLIDTNCQ